MNKPINCVHGVFFFEDYPFFEDKCQIFSVKVLSA